MRPAPGFSHSLPGSFSDWLLTGGLPDAFPRCEPAACRGGLAARSRVSSAGRQGRRRKWGFAYLFQIIPGIHPDLIELEQAIDGLEVPFTGQVQQPPSLIHFLFFSMGGGSSFHQVTFRSFLGEKIVSNPRQLALYT